MIPHIIREDGSRERYSPSNGKDFTLAELQKAVDGKIEVIRLTDVSIMVVNDEGKFAKHVNSVATILALLNGAIHGTDYVCGDVLLCPSDMVK